MDIEALQRRDRYFPPVVYTVSIAWVLLVYDIIFTMYEYGQSGLSGYPILDMFLLFWINYDLIVSSFFLILSVILFAGNVKKAGMTLRIKTILVLVYALYCIIFVFHLSGAFEPEQKVDEVRVETLDEIVDRLNSEGYTIDREAFKRAFEKSGEQ